MNRLFLIAFMVSCHTLTSADDKYQGVIQSGLLIAGYLPINNELENKCENQSTLLAQVFVLANFNNSSTCKGTDCKIIEGILLQMKTYLNQMVQERCDEQFNDEYTENALQQKLFFRKIKLNAKVFDDALTKRDNTVTILPYKVLNRIVNENRTRRPDIARIICNFCSFNR